MLEHNKIYNMDCIEGIKKLPDNSVDAIVTDPPYGLTSQRIYSKVKDVDEIKGNGTLNRNIKENTCYGSLVGGFMGKKWDGSGIELNPDYVKIANERLKPYLEQQRLEC